MEIIDSIREKASKIGKAKLMEVCGGHTNVIIRYGIRDILPDNIRLISGPGCPVCVTSQYDIDCMIELAMSKIPVATYGDALKVPGARGSLEGAKARYNNVFEVYSAEEVLTLKKRYDNIVFFGIGFETTSPMSAFLLSKGISVYSAHKLIIPAMQSLLLGGYDIQGFINPGHVSTIIGSEIYRVLPVPQVICGFTPREVLLAVDKLLEMIIDGKREVVNGYEESVRPAGNTIAQKLLKEQFYIVDADWRGLGFIKESGLEVRNNELNAKKRYIDILRHVPLPGKSACRCGDVLKGMLEPEGCALFANLCTPDNPKGACMVSGEGACQIKYRYRK